MNTKAIPAESPFSVHNNDAYLLWRDQKLSHYPDRLEDLCVTIQDPRHLNSAERDAILARCRKSNMAIYQSATGHDPDRQIPSLLGEQFGLHHIDHNPGSDENSITAITVTNTDGRGEFIPYTDRSLHWHTDGYYNTQDKQIRGFILHCVNPAAIGGENALLDHEIAYILLREADPAFISALMDPEAMTIPAYSVDGVLRRPESKGPVFSVAADGTLHMRYTMRTRNINWKQDPILEAALAFLGELFTSHSPYIFRAFLQAGWGVINNNILHARTSFTDNGEKARLLYRARYYDRISGTA